MGYDKYGLHWLDGNKPTKKNPEQKPKPQPQQQTKPAPEPPKPKEKPAPEYRFKSVKIVIPEGGLIQNQPFEAEGEVELLEGITKIKTPRVLCDAVTEYKEQKDTIAYDAQDYIDDQNRFKLKFKHLFYNDPYERDDTKPVDATFTLTLHLHGYTAEKDFQSEPLKLPTSPKKITIPWIIDCHMHINSGHCAPLPLTKAQVPLPFIDQQRIDTLGSINIGPVGFGDFGYLQKKSTDVIGNFAIAESGKLLYSPEFKYFGDPADRRRLLIALSMNMDYAHYRGYLGIPIYETINGETCWWNTKESRFETVSSKDTILWESYNKQLKKMKQIYDSSDGTILFFYHYDPRANICDWKVPFIKHLVQTASQYNLARYVPCIGIKMYTLLGYSPLDKNMHFPWDDYYQICSDNQIPIICHGSRGGMTTHDILKYYDYEYPHNVNAPPTFKINWFTDNFVSPYAWEPVLKKHPKLILCLAHFGGDTFWDKDVNSMCDVFWENLNDVDIKNWIAGYLHLINTYPNFYVDLSYFLFKPSMREHFKKALSYDLRIKECILFGTDWWLFTKDDKYKQNFGYAKYVHNMCEQIEALNDKDFLNRIGIHDIHELLAYFMVLNPMRFLQLKKHASKLKTAYNSSTTTKNKGKYFQLTEWIYDVPEDIKKFYK